MMVTVPGFISPSAAKRTAPKGWRSAIRFDGACKTATAMENFGRFCWKERLRSTVTNTSNSVAASWSNCPFFMAAHPIWGTVRTKCPDKLRANRRSMHSSSSSFTLSGVCDHRFARRLKELDHLLTTHGREPLQKIGDRISGFQIIKQSPDGHPSAPETRRSSHHVHFTRDQCVFHYWILPFSIENSSKQKNWL